MDSSKFFQLPTELVDNTHQRAGQALRLSTLLQPAETAAVAYETFLQPLSESRLTQATAPLGTYDSTSGVGEALPRFALRVCQHKAIDSHRHETFNRVSPALSPSGWLHISA